jgi:hypothetical protein
MVEKVGGKDEEKKQSGGEHSRFHKRFAKL